MSTSQTFVTRFAPTPNGPLHFGSLVTAVASFLQCRKAGGRWLLRFDDLDEQRVKEDFISVICRQLEGLGLEWDASPIRQSARKQRYKQVMEELRRKRRIFACVCSRKELARRIAKKNTFGEFVYDGFCLESQGKGREGASLSSRSLRLDLSGDFSNASSTLAFVDALQGPVSFSPLDCVGPIILQRKEGFFSYHFANAIDDHDLGISNVLRGCDLLGAAQKQLVISAAVGLKTPQFAHLALVHDADGVKLGKSRLSPSLDLYVRQSLLYQAMTLLGLDVPKEASLPELWGAALENFSLEVLPAVQHLKMPRGLAQV